MLSKMLRRSATSFFCECARGNQTFESLNKRVVLRANAYAAMSIGDITGAATRLPRQYFTRCRHERDTHTHDDATAYILNGHGGHITKHLLLLGFSFLGEVPPEREQTIARITREGSPCQSPCRSRHCCHQGLFYVQAAPPPVPTGPTAALHTPTPTCP